MISFFCILACIILAISCIIWLAVWSVHFSMTRDYSTKWGFGNFGTFLHEFRKRSWKQDTNFSGSFFNDHPSESYDFNEVHAGIIKFGGNGLVLDPISYLFFMVWKFQQRQIVKKYQKDLWK